MASSRIDELVAAPLPPLARRIFCNRTLNVRGLAAIGFDMDYTLVHYRVEEWERRAYEYVRERLGERGLPVEGLEFDPDLAKLGLIIDVELGNLVKANRFGYVKRASHGSQMLDYEAQRVAYARTVLDLADRRWVFLNTLFGLSEACLFMQLVDRLDEGRLAPGIGYPQLYALVRSTLDQTHMEGRLKAEIVAAPERFVEIDEELPRALLDLIAAGRKLLLITNSEWSYTRAMMSFAFNRFLPAGTTWRSLFHLVIVGARKPAFFTERMPAFEVIDDEGRLLPAVGRLEPGRAYLGGHAALIEESLALDGESILYVGDHIFSDVNVSKSVNRWRTMLVLRDLESEIEAVQSFDAQQRELVALMDDKELREHRFSQLRLAVLRAEHELDTTPLEMGKARARLREMREELVALDERIGPLAKQASELSSERWGLLLRTGNDKSHLARQIERHADAYTSRVSNLLYSTPFVYLRSPRGSMPHDP